MPVIVIADNVMGEIDDLYTERVESLENDFFEEFKKGKDRKKVVEDYHKKLENLVKEFEKNYKDSLEKEKKLLLIKKNQKEEEINYKTLKVEHLDFNLTRYEKFSMKWNLFWFKFGRIYRRNILKFTPKYFVYLNYKLKIVLKNFFNTTKEIIVRFLESIWHFLVRMYFIIFRGIIELIHSIVNFVKKVISSIYHKKEGEKKQDGSKEKEIKN
jgi:hypothetical protein